MICISFTQSLLHPPSHDLRVCHFPDIHYVVLYLCTNTTFLAPSSSSLLSKNGLMADASVDSRLGGLFVPVPTTTKRLKISCLFLGCVALGTVSHSGCKGYCLQDLHRPGFPFLVGLLQPDETARKRGKEEGREERRGGRDKER